MVKLCTTCLHCQTHCRTDVNPEEGSIAIVAVDLIIKLFFSNLHAICMRQSATNVVKKCYLARLLSYRGKFSHGVNFLHFSDPC